MKFAICNEMFGGQPFSDVCRLVRSIGYTGIELAPFTLCSSSAPLSDVRELTEAARQNLRVAAADAGVEIVGLHWLLAHTAGLHLTSPDVATRRRTADYLMALAECCADLGGQVLVFGSPQQRRLLPGVDREAAVDFAIKVLQQALPTCEQLGVTIALEPLAASEDNFLNTAADTVQLIEQLDSPACRLHLDVKAMTSEPSPIPQIIHDNASWLVHFHANDPNRLGPGMGDVDFAPILQALRAMDYAGWISVEPFRYEPSAEEVARVSWANLQAALDP